MANVTRAHRPLSSQLSRKSIKNLHVYSIHPSTVSPLLLIKCQRYHLSSRAPSTPATSFARPVLPQPQKHTSTSKAFTSIPSTRAVAAPRRPINIRNRDRGPISKEDTQTDFGVLNVLGATANPSTSVDICTFDGFMLDSGLTIGDGDGVLLTGSEAFVWRPWMGGVDELRGSESATGVKRKGDGTVNANALRTGTSESERTGGVLNAKGQFEVAQQGWGLFSLLWPKPDLLIIGTGPTIRPLAPTTRNYLQELGVRIEVLDTRNAASQFNLLATERGVQEVAAALVPLGFGLAKNIAAVDGKKRK